MGSGCGSVGRSVDSDTRGPWLGVKGHWISKTGGQINFVYCWSKGSKLLIAPWETDSYPETRTFNDLP